MPSLDSLKEEIREVFQIFDEDDSGTISIPELSRGLYTITGERVSRSELMKLISLARESLAAQQRDKQQQAQRKQQQQQQQLLQRAQQAARSSTATASQHSVSAVTGGDHESAAPSTAAPGCEEEDEGAHGKATASKQPGAPHSSSSPMTAEGNEGKEGMLADEGEGGRGGAENLRNQNRGNSALTSPVATTTPTAPPLVGSALPGDSLGSHAGGGGGAWTMGHSGGGTATTASVRDNDDGVDVELFEEVVLRRLNGRSYEEELAFAFSLLEDKYYPGFITKESLKRAAMETEEPLTEAEVLEMFDIMVTGVPTAAVDINTFSAIQDAARLNEDR